VGLANELEKGGLERIFGRVWVDEDAPTDPKNGSRVPADDALERLRIAGLAIATEQFGVIRQGGGIQQFVDFVGPQGSSHRSDSGASRSGCHYEEEAPSGSLDMGKTERQDQICLVPHCEEIAPPTIEYLGDVRVIVPFTWPDRDETSTSAARHHLR
jgi:hypothetical protein